MGEKCRILQLVDLGFGVFEEVVETSLFFAKKISNREAYEVQLAAKGATTERIDRLSRTIPSNEIAENIETGFAFFSQKTNLKAKFFGIAEPLVKSFVVYRGVETRDNEKYLATERLTQDYRPILMGTDVDRYTCQWTDTYVKFGPKELKSNADMPMYDVPEKVLLRTTGSRIIAS